MVAFISTLMLITDGICNDIDYPEVDGGECRERDEALLQVVYLRIRSSFRVAVLV